MRHSLWRVAHCPAFFGLRRGGGWRYVRALRSRAVSSAGRASRLHREGRRFESVTAHQPSRLRRFGWHASLDREGCPSKPEGRRRARRLAEPMRYVYLLESINYPNERYIGLTDDLRSRFRAHNAGRSPHTRKFRPWRLVSYIAFSDEQKAIDFERYLKSASGRAFANKRLR